MSEGARDGVTRARAIAALRSIGIAVREAKLRVGALRAADELFVTSSLRGVRPLVRLDGAPVRDGEPGKITRRVALWLEGD
jgi:branched-subunit amino acid aminotransferase/4-amino-4-deoxychorismate lyase